MYIQPLIQQLERIADENGDRFKYSIDIKVTRQGLITFTFTTVETADGHAFLCSAGDTPEMAAHYAHKHIKEACKAWGYKFVE